MPKISLFSSVWNYISNDCSRNDKVKHTECAKQAQSMEKVWSLIWIFSAIIGAATGKSRADKSLYIFGTMFVCTVKVKFTNQ